MRLSGVARPEVDCRRFPKIGWNSHVGVRADAPKFERMRRRLASIAERADDRVINRHFRAIRVQNPFDARRMRGEPGVNLANPGDMPLDLSLYAAADSIDILLLRKVLHVDDDFGTACR